MNGMAPTGKAVAFRDVTIRELREGKIIEQRGLSDYLTKVQQLGVIPEGRRRCRKYPTADKQFSSVTCAHILITWLRHYYYMPC